MSIRFVENGRGRDSAVPIEEKDTVNTETGRQEEDPGKPDAERGIQPLETAEITFWGEQKGFGHSNEMTIFTKLLVYRQRYIDSIADYENMKQDELARRKREWDLALQTFRVERDACEKKRLEDINREIERFSQFKRDRKDCFSKDKEDYDTQIDHIRKKLDVLGKLNKYKKDDEAKLLKAKKCFLDAIEELEKERQNKKEGYDSDKGDMMAVYETNINQIEAASEEELKAIDERKKAQSDEYDALCTDIERKYSEKIDNINREYERLLCENFDNRHISGYLEHARRYMISGDHFVCPGEMSKYIHFGNLFVHMDRTYETAKGFDRLIRDHAQVISVDSARKMTLALPYLQSFREGVSLVIKHNGSDQVRDLLKDIVMKTLMSYPAGKVVATMIDPKGLGGSFAGLGRLGGDKNTWLRDTKIWSEETEIEGAINRFRETAENWIQIYGGDKEALLKKEQLKVLAIMDFPQHFNDRAMDGLQAIIRNCKDTGTIVYIMSQKEEFDHLMEESPDKRDDFRKCVMLEQIEDNNDFIVNNYNRYHVSLQGFSTIRKNANAIINALSHAADSYQSPIIPFSSLYKKDMLDSNNWFTGNPRSFSVPIGYHSFNAPMSLSFGAVNDTKQNVLIEGMPRSGKTNLLHNIILGGLLNYKPQYLQFYLIDFKDGVEFREYADYFLPGIKVIAVDAQREFALSILEELVDEMTRRNNEFGRISTNDIESYNKSIGASEIMPRLVLIFDEVTSLFGSSDPVSQACLEHIMKIQTKGGNVGIHTILATQDYNQCNGLNVDRDFSLAKIRIVTFGREDTTCSILKSTEGMAIGRIGSALFNDNGGEASNNRYLRVGTSKREALPKEEPNRQDYLEQLDDYYRKVADLYTEYETHVWTQDLEKNPNLYFNQVIRNAGDDIALANTKLVPGTDVGMLTGNGIRNNFYVTTFKQEEKENLLLLGSTEGNDGRMVESIVICMLLSIVCECAIKRKTQSRVYIIDGSVKRGTHHKDKKKVRLNDLSELFDIVDYYRGRDDSFAVLLRDISEEIDIRSSIGGGHPPIYLVINKIDDMEFYFRSDSHGNAADGRTLLHKILAEGPEVGVHVIMIGEYFDVVVSHILDNRVNDYFNKRIAIHFDDSDKQFQMVYKREIADSRHSDKLAVIYDRISEEAEVDMFSVYDVPDRAWVEQIAMALDPEQEEW